MFTRHFITHQDNIVSSVLILHILSLSIFRGSFINKISKKEIPSASNHLVVLIMRSYLIRTLYGEFYPFAKIVAIL